MRSTVDLPTPRGGAFTTRRARPRRAGSAPAAVRQDVAHLLAVEERHAARQHVGTLRARSCCSNGRGCVCGAEQDREVGPAVALHAHELGDLARGVVGLATSSSIRSVAIGSADAQRGAQRLPEPPGLWR
jgi:hypothetical protein